LNPHASQKATDFKSVVSTNFTTFPKSQKDIIILLS
jgi:hypothetical protein